MSQHSDSVSASQTVGQPLTQQTIASSAPSSTPTAVPPSEKIIQTVNQLMHEGFEIDPAKLVPGATLQADLGLDSLDAVDMLVYIEEKMGVRIEGERLKSVKTLADVYVLAAESVPRLDVKAHASQ